jgi:hypothetical protein
MSNFNKNAAIDVYYTTVTIATSGTVSTAVDLYGYSLLGIITPAAMTGTALTVQASHDGSTFNVMYDTDGSALSITSAASRFIALAPQDFASVRHLKLVSGSTEAAERTITLAIRKL